VAGKMDMFEVIRTRRSIRKYIDKPVEKEKLLRVLEAARLAPSAVNRQPWDFIVITDPKIKEEMKSAYSRDWFYSAPVIIVACASPSKAWVRKDGEEYWKVDAAIAMQNLVLAAWAEGLGTCWIGAFDEQEVKKTLGIPPEIRVVAMTPLGYPAEKKEPVTDRKPLSEIVHYDHW
jgi:nitroreductase